MKILLTGATGFIGRNIKEQWTGRYDLYAPDRKMLNLLDTANVNHYLEENKFDVIIHTANTNDFKEQLTPFEILNNNLRMFYNLEKNSHLYGKMFYFGSGAEYDSQHYIPKMKEDYFGRFLPKDPYGFAKYTMSKIAQNSHNIYDLRLFGVYGKYEQWQRRFISNALCRSIKGMPITISQNVVFDYLHVDDLCRILEVILKCELKYHCYNICAGQTKDLRSIANMINEITGLNRTILIEKPGYKLEYSGDNQQLKEEIGDYKTKDLRCGIEQLYEYYLSIEEDIDKELLI